MNYINLRKRYIILFICFTSFTYSYAQIAASLASGPDQITLNVTEDLETSIAISWRTNEMYPTSKLQIVKETSSSFIGKDPLEYIAKSEKLDFKGRISYHHTKKIEGLEHGTVYAYRVGEGDFWSEWMNFSTLGRKDTPLKFLYFGDVQSNIKSLWTRVAKQAIRTMPDAELIVYAGDIVNRGLNLHEWEDWYYATGNMHHTIPLMPASGNHDHADSDDGKYNITPYWNKQFNLPANGAAGLPGTTYYTDVKDTRFIVLNTEMFDTEEASHLEQLTWLKEVLASNKQKWLIILMHHPIYSTKSNRDNIELRQLIKPLIDQYKVDLVLQGHDHNYARGKDRIPMENGKKSNTTYVVSVSGPKMSDVVVADWMDKSVSFTQLFHSIIIHDNKLEFSSYLVNGQLFDKFTLVKNGEINEIIN